MQPQELESPTKSNSTQEPINWRLMGLHLLYQHIDRFQLNQSRSLTDICSNKLTKVEQIQEAYLAVWQTIIYFNEEAASQNIDQSNPRYTQYLSLKRTQYIKFYAYYQDKILDQSHTVFVFDSQNLRGLFEQIKDFANKMKPLISKKHGKEGSQLKIQGFLLLQKIQELLKEIKIAIYPFSPQGKLQIQNSKQFKEFLQTDLQIYNQLQLSKQMFVSHSIVELGYEIQNMMKNLGQKEKQFLNRPQLTQSVIMEHVKHTDTLSHYRLMLFYHQTLNHYYKFISNPVQLTAQLISQFIQAEPLSKLTKDSIQEFKTVQELKQIELSRFFRFHKKVILRLANLQGEKTFMISKEDLLKLVEIVMGWIGLVKLRENQLLLVQNFIVLLRICFRQHKPYIEQNIQSIHQILMKYVNELTNNLLNEYISVMNKIIDYDEELTYELLTTGKIISTLLAQENSIKRLIQQFSPLLQLTIGLSNLLNMQNKLEFIHEVTSKLQYASWTQQFASKAEMNSKIKLKKVTSNIDAILAIDLQHQSFMVIKPYLRQLKYIMLLLQSLKGNKKHRNISKNDHEQYSQLQQVAKYFTLQRSHCVFYQLKAQIMLFISLFKLGYHTPTYKHQGNIVNLRNHVDNLYTKLFNSNRGSNIFLSRIGLDQVFRRKSSNQMSFLGQPKMLEKAQGSYVWQKKTSTFELEEQAVVELGASESLTQRLKNFIKNINNNLVELESNSKTYLLNLLSILENQLFHQQKQHYQQSQRVLTGNYIEHVKNSLDFKGVSFSHQNINKLMQIQGLFYNQMYEKAWKILIKEKSHNQHFNLFINDLLASSNAKSQILKLIRIYKTFSKMNHLFYNTENEEKNVSELLQSINQNSNLPISETAVKAIYCVCAQQSRVQQLQEFFQRFKNGNDKKVEQEYEQFNSGFSQSGIITSKIMKNMKEMILIRVLAKHGQVLQQIKADFQRYFLLNQPGISKVNYTNVVKGDLLIEIESNPFFVLQPRPNVSKIMLNNEDYSQNSVQKVARNFASSLIQVYDLLNVSEQYQQKIELDQIFISQQTKSYNINPYFMLLRSILNSQNKANSQHKKKPNNRLWLASLLQNTCHKMKARSSPHFFSNFNFLVELLRVNTLPNSRYSSFLQVPLFMTLHQKEIFIVYFDNKMSEMCDKFLDTERQLKKNKKYREADQLRATHMKNQVFRNHRYNFIANGIVQRQMIDLKICNSTDQSKLDWTTNHKNLKISYQLPKTQDNQVKQYAYSLNIFMKCLRGAIAHKVKHNYEIVQSFSQEYPELLDFLYNRKHLLQIKYSQLMESKNSWLKTFFLENDRIANKIKKILGDQIKSSSDKVLQAYQKLKQYSAVYKKEVTKKMNSLKVKCEKCNQFIKIVASSKNLLDLLSNLAKNLSRVPKFLSVEHFYNDCYLADTFKNHRQLKLFGQRVKESEVKNHLLISWWFYLQTTFPSLMQMLKRIRHLVELE